MTMDAEQGVRFLQIVRPRTTVPIHFNDHTVFKSPLDDFPAGGGDGRPRVRDALRRTRACGRKLIARDRRATAAPPNGPLHPRAP